MKEKLYDIVKEVLHRKPEARDDDTLLTVAIIHSKMPDCYKIEDGKAWIAYRAMKKYREDHISRMRRKIQEEGLYLPTTEEVRKQRQISEEKWIEWSRRGNGIIDGGNPSFT